MPIILGSTARDIAVYTQSSAFVSSLRVVLNYNIRDIVLLQELKIGTTEVALYCGRRHLIAAAMTSLNTYNVLDKVVPAVLMVTLIVVVFVVVLVITIANKGEAPDGFIDFLALYFPSNKTKKKKDVEILQDILDNKWFALLPIILIPIIAGTTFITFWNVFLMELSFTDSCAADFDCFPKVGSDYLQQEPVKNCSMYESYDGVTYKCYRLVFRYAQGLGVAGGFHLLMVLWSKPYFALLISLYQREIPRRNLDILIWSGAILIFLFLLAISVGVPDIRERVFHTICHCSDAVCNVCFVSSTNCSVRYNCF